MLLDFACTVVTVKERPAHTMIAAKTYEVLRKAWARLSGFRCEMRRQRELFTFGDQRRGHAVRAMLHAVDVVVTYGCKAVAAHSELVLLGHSIGTVMGSTLEKVLMGSECSFRTIVNVEHLFIAHLWCVTA